MLDERVERNIKAIIIDTYEEEAKFQDEDFDDFYIFISTIMDYGYSIDEIKEFAAKYNIKINSNNTEFDSLEINKTKINKLKK